MQRTPEKRQHLFFDLKKKSIYFIIKVGGVANCVAVFVYGAFL